MTALTVRLCMQADRAAVDHLKVATGEATASRAILRAVRECPDLLDQLREERRTTAALRTALRAVADADNNLARAGARPSARPARPCPTIDATPILEDRQRRPRSAPS